MPWSPLPRIAFAIATHPFNPSSKHDLPLELGDELYIIESCNNGEWFRGYLVAPPSVLSGLTSRQGQTLEARVFSGIFPSACVRIREVLGPQIPLHNDDDYDEDLGMDDHEFGLQDRLQNGLHSVNPSQGMFKNGLQVDIQVHEDNGDDDMSDSQESIHINGHQQGADGVQHLDDDVDRDTETEVSFSFANGGLHHPPRHHHHPPLPPKPTGQRLLRTASKASKVSMGKRQRTTSKSRPIHEKPPAPVPMLKVGDETATHESEPLVDEIASCLREWHSSNLHELLLSRQYTLLDSVSKLVQQLDLARRQLLHNVLTATELLRTREKTVWELVRGNKILSREIIVREPTTGRMLVGDDSAIAITSLQAQMSLLEAPPVEKHDGITLHHVMLDLKAFIGITSESTTLVFYLANRQNQPLSESFRIELTPQGVPVDVSPLNRIQTLFTDMSTRDIADEVYLIARVLTNSTVQASSGPVSGVGVSGHSYYSLPQNSGGTLVSSHSSPTVPTNGTLGKSNRMSVMFTQNAKPNGHSKLQTSQSFSGIPSTTGSSASSSIITQEQHPKMITCRKSLGVGVLDITRFLREEIAMEHVMRVFVPLHTASTQQQQYGTLRGHHEKPSQSDIGDWEGLVKDIIESRTDRFEKSPKADRIHINLRPFTSPDAEMLKRTTPTLLHNVLSTPKIGFSGAPIKPRSDIYLTIKNVIIPRHAMLLHPKAGPSALPIVANLQLSLEVRTEFGEPIQDCIFSASNLPGCTTWLSTLVNRDDGWHETIKLAVPAELVHNAHVFITLAFGAGTHPIALTWLPLSNNGVFVRDGDHISMLYRHDDYTSSALGNSSLGETGYLSLPWENSTSIPNHASVSCLKIRSFLCSTQFSQDDTLLGLLKWRETKSESDLIDILKKFGYIPELEVVKLLGEVFDALFGLLVERAGREEFEDLVFNALVTVLNIVYDRRFHLEPIVDEYTSKHFNYPFATACLIRSFSRLLSNPSDPDASKHLRATFKVGRHVLRFITFAREQQKEKEAGIGITSSSAFTKDLQGIFKLLEQLMRNTNPMLVGSQTLAVQHFHTWLPELTALLPTDDILLIAIDFMDACSNVKGKLILYKLILIVNYSKSQLFSDADARRAIALNTVRWIEPYWDNPGEVTIQYREQIRLCCSILSTQIDKLGDDVSGYIPKIVSSYLTIKASSKTDSENFSLLFPVSYPFPTRTVTVIDQYDEVLLELSAVLAAMSNLPTALTLDLSEAELADFLVRALQVHTSILNCEAFPASWLSVHIYQHKATMKFLETTATVLIESFLPEPDDAEKFNMELWLVFFTTLLKVVGSDALALETFPEQKRRAVWKVGGDIREQGAELLRRTWEAIGWDTSIDERQKFGMDRMGGYQVQYVPGLVAPIVELCLCVHEGLRITAVEVLQSMIISEWTLSQDLSVIQTEVIDELDRLFKSKQLSESITQKLFLVDLARIFEPLASYPDDPLNEKIKDLLSTIDEFLDLLVAVHNTSLGEAYHIMDTLRLMDFLKDVRKEDMFIRYVHQLVTIQLKHHNYVEAGLSLQLHADLYGWDPNLVVPAVSDPKISEQSMFDRKESLCMQMIGHFEEGKSWENALDVYKELALQYEHVMFDYAKLSKAFRAIARLYENIMRGDRQVPRYYKIAYFGMGFPIGLRDKHFIVQGNAYDDLATFTDNVRQDHPAAKVVGHGEVDNVEGQFLQVIEVLPELDMMHPVNQRQKASAHVREFLQSSRPKHFSTSKDYEDDKTIEWTEKVVYETIDHFPTILRRSEVVHVTPVRCSPINTMLDIITRRTQDSRTFEKQIQQRGHSTDHDILVKEFAKHLQNAITGPVQKYRRLIEIENNRVDGEECERPELVNALKTAVLDHVGTLKRCFATYAKMLQGTGKQDNLTPAFEQAFAPELSILTPLQHNTEHVTAPITIQIRSKNNHNHNTNILDVPHITTSPPPISTSMFNSPTVNDSENVTMSSTPSSPPSRPNPTPEPQSRRERLSMIFSSSSRDDVSIANNKQHYDNNDHDHNHANNGNNKNRSGSVSSSRRPSTTSSHMGASGSIKTGGGSGNSGVNGVSGKGDRDNGMIGNGGQTSPVIDRVGSMRKRLSILKIGKKSSKTNVRGVTGGSEVSSVIEE